MRALLVARPFLEWQDICNLAEKKINYCSPDGAPSPFLLWYGRDPEVAADRLISSVLRPYTGDGDRVDNSGATVVNKLVKEANAKQAYMDRLNLLWEDAFVARREAEAEGFRSRPVSVGDTVRTSIDVLQAKLDPRWSEKKTVRLVKGNVIYVEVEERPYHAWQVKVVPKDKAKDEGVELADEGCEAEESGDEEGPEGQADSSEGVVADEGTRQRRRRVDGETTFLQSLHNQRDGKRRITPTAKARGAVGEEGEVTPVVPMGNYRSPMIDS
jgi:hypothetical protein